MTLWGMLITVYIVIGGIWGVLSGLEYSDNRDRSSALFFLGTIVWPVIVLVLLLRFIFRAIGTAIRE